MSQLVSLISVPVGVISGKTPPPPPTPRLTSEVNRPRPRGDPTRPPDRRLRVDVSH